MNFDLELTKAILLMCLFVIIMIVLLVISINYFIDVIRVPRGSANIKELVGLYVTIFACLATIGFISYHAYFLGNTIYLELLNRV